MRKYFSAIFNVMILIHLFACDNKSIIYNPDQKRSVYFYEDAGLYISGVIPDTVQFSFAAMDESIYQYNLPIRFIGMPAEKELECIIEVVDDSTTAVSGKHFKMGKGNHSAKRS